MNAPHNPYAPSPASITAGEVRQASYLQRDGKILLLPVGGDLPNLCVKCNAPADEPTKTRKVYWHHPGFYALLLINVLLYIVVALIARKSETVTPGLCAQHKKKRALGLWIGWGGFVVGFVAMTMTMGSDTGLGLFFFFAMLAAIITGMFMARIVFAKRIDDRYIRLGGCGKEFLAEVPEYRPSARDLA